MNVRIVIPPNTTAVVTLPGANSDVFEVGPGTHHWSYAYQDPDGRGPISVDDFIGDLADIPAAWVAVKESIARLAPRSHFLKFGLLTQRKTTLRQALAGLPNSEEVLASISDAFSRL